MDPDYVMYAPQPEGSVVASVAAQRSVALRRAQAMRQWTIARADGDCEEARTCLRHLMVACGASGAGGQPPHWALAAWQANVRQTATLPDDVHVGVGEELVPGPVVCLDRAEQCATLAADAPGDPLLLALAALDVNAVLLALQPHDPISWHCAARYAQQQWFMRSQEGGCTAPTPHPRTVPSTACVLRRPHWDDAPAAAATHHQLQPPEEPLTVHLDVLDYPLGRHRRIQLGGLSLPLTAPATAHRGSRPPNSGPKDRPAAGGGASARVIYHRRVIARPVTGDSGRPRTTRPRDRVRVPAPVAVDQGSSMSSTCKRRRYMK